jgi:hypothetical protein
VGPELGFTRGALTVAATEGGVIQGAEVLRSTGKNAAGVLRTSSAASTGRFPSSTSTGRGAPRNLHRRVANRGGDNGSRVMITEVASAFGSTKNLKVVETKKFVNSDRSAIVLRGG